MCDKKMLHGHGGLTTASGAKATAVPLSLFRLELWNDLPEHACGAMLGLP